MKKTLVIIAVACIAFAMPAQAQVKFGLKGGVNLNNLSTSGKVFDESNQTGFFVGPTVKFTVPLIGLSFDASALFDQRSAEYKEFDGVLYTRTIKSQSIQIPINIRYGVGLSSLVNVFAFAGPQFGFNVGDNYKEWWTEIGYTGWSLKKSNISGNVGIGATILSKLQITANYNFQVSKAAELIDDDDVVGKMKFNSWQLGLAYYF